MPNCIKCVSPSMKKCQYCNTLNIKESNELCKTKNWKNYREMKNSQTVLTKEGIRFRQKTGKLDNWLYHKRLEEYF